jgi:thiol-disulfide isomerase/thioredoxin
MKKVFIILMSLFIYSGIQAQVYWLSDFAGAKALAKKSNKLIVIDFWASWCGPCVAMDKEVWNDPELKKIAKNFIGLRINVDMDKATPTQYNVTGIPKVAIITATGEVIWEKQGFFQSGEYLKIFTSIPENIGDLNAKSLAAKENKKDMQALYSAGIEFLRIGITIKNDDLKNSFLVCSRDNFSKALKVSKDPVLTEEINLYSILNDVYMGKHQKALKQIEKIDKNTKNENSVQLMHLILAKCYKNAGDENNFQKEKQLIVNKEFISQLEN